MSKDSQTTLEACDKCGSTDDVIDINEDAPYPMPEKHFMCANCCEAEWTRRQERYDG